MTKLRLALAVLPLIVGTPAAATIVIDPTGDFVPGYTGPQTGDFDVNTFAVGYDPTTEIFRIAGTLNGNIDPTIDAFYVIGVNTGTGVIAPFGSIGNPNVIFNQVVVVDSSGDAFVGTNDLTFDISGNTFEVFVPLGFLPSTGFDPLSYGFNLWPRTDLTPSNLSAISDFAPDNALISASVVPEPMTWLTMLLGFAFVGTVLRFRRSKDLGLGVVTH